ncbi:hypothetical protein HOL24_09920 [bacterium]|jgi:hypothetical protein|nr:hypothetical protein [bacterium]
MDELDRCAYYYIRMGQDVEKLNNRLEIKYSELIDNPNQAVTIGSDLGKNGAGSASPRLGKWAVLFRRCYSNRDCNIGDNVIFGTNAFLRNTDIKNNTIVLERWSKNRLSNNTYQNHKYFLGKYLSLNNISIDNESKREKMTCRKVVECLNDFFIHSTSKCNFFEKLFGGKYVV